MIRFRHLLGFICVMVLRAPLSAQEFSASQKEVWKNVQTYYALEMKQDFEGFMSYFHEDYRGWSYDNPLPIDKATVRSLVSLDMATTKILVQNFQPAAIQIHANVAFVDYYYSRVIEDEGKEATQAWRYTDILMKEGDKWLLIGDHGGQTSKP